MKLKIERTTIEPPTARLGDLEPGEIFEFRDHHRPGPLMVMKKPDPNQAMTPWVDLSDGYQSSGACYCDVIRRSFRLVEE